MRIALIRNGRSRGDVQFGRSIHETLQGPGLLREALSRLYRTGRATLQSTRNADVAQLVEQPIRNRQVTGSSPVVGSRYGIQVRWNLLRFLSGFVPLFPLLFQLCGLHPFYLLRIIALAVW
jgi:hypothetical protein